MQDLASTHLTPSHPYQWSREELKSVLCAYAYLHTSRVKDLSYSWLVPRHESLLDFDKIPEQVAIVQRAGIWGDIPELDDLIAYARESCRKYADEDITLLHGDTTPANALLPKETNSRPATLIDWQDVGIGMPEFDLAYIDLQPFESAHLVPRRDLLDQYWQYRAELDPVIPGSEERRARQLHADVVTALWLTAAAARVTLHPFPQGSPQNTHWISQYETVYNRLRSLGPEIKNS
jgi:Ser/Thr protein kinase RdoA (MazF antagonist)